MNPTRRGCAVLLLALSLACRGEAPAEPAPPSAARVALELFELAAAERPDEARVDALFGLDEDDGRRPALYDALRRLAEAVEPRVVAAEPLDGEGRGVVDLEATLLGGGKARYAVQVEQQQASWRIGWFQGPGVEWPPPRNRRDEGLTTSPEPQRVKPRGGG